MIWTQRIARLAFAIGVGITLWFALSQNTTSLVESSDKFNHLAAFFVLSVLLDYAWLNVLEFKAKALALLVFGILIEVLQLWVGYRSFELGDLVADSAGIISYGILRSYLRASIDKYCAKYIG
ncbi:MAG: VanZ family protein [Betaproteobacteria bacterium]|jgi:VanZ family protein